MEQISKDAIISEILVANPEKAQLLSEIMMDFGIHCVGCGAASFETLEQGVLGHGFSEEQLTKLVENLNKAVKDDSQKSSTEQIQEFKLDITENAIKKVKESMEKENSTLRISVVGGGCSGFMYNLEFIGSPSPTDLNFKQDDVNIAVDKNSLEFLNGVEIDFIDTLNESGFKFNNPNASAGCGCGKSFN
jgi:iron-sulfur cluster assembly accessory protein